MGAHMLCFRQKIYDPDICHFLIVLHDQCNLDFEYSKTYKLLTQSLSSAKIIKYHGYTVI